MEAKRYGGRDDILEADDRLTEEVFVPEFGNKTYLVRGLTGQESEKFQAGLGYVKDGRWYSTAKGKAMARLVALSVIDGDGKAIFSEDDVDMLNRKNAAGLNRIADVCRKLSGLSKEDVEELEGDFDKGPSSDSSSTSPSRSVAPVTNSSQVSAVAS